MNDQTTLEPYHADRAPPGQPGWELSLAILYHPDLRRVGEWLRLSAAPGTSWSLGRSSPAFARARGPSEPLADPGVSRAPVEISVGVEGLSLSPTRSDLRLRVDDTLAKGIFHVSNATLGRGFRLALNERVVLWIQRVRERSLDGASYDLVGVSAAMDALRSAIHDVGRASAPVLLRGATGVGKERVARALHDASARRAGPFVAVNVAAIPAETAVSQLFGHARGAFTGAAGAHDGWFGQADGGTLFLDEIGDLPEVLQPMLLRALESGEIQPVGGRTRRVDVRVIAATDVDLQQHLGERRFRESLYYRLAQRAIAVPSLAERPSDIPVLWTHFVLGSLDRLGATAVLSGDGPAPWMPIEVVDALLAHRWAGNVRELRAAAEAFTERHARHAVAEVPSFPASEAAAGEAAPKGLDLLEALEANDWAILPTARALGVSRNALRRQMADRGVRRAKDLDEREVAEAIAAASGDVELAARTLGVSARALKLRIG